jgi:branched-chain amino acid transport system permease protein
MERPAMAVSEAKRAGASTRSRQLWLTGSVVTVAVLAAVPLFTDRRDLLNLLFLVYLAVCLGQSWNILGGFAGQVNLGHAAFFGIGALVARNLWAVQGYPFVLAFAAGGLAAVAFAMVIGVPTFRLRGVYFAIGTLGVGEVLRLTTANALPLVSALPTELVNTYDIASRYQLALALAAASTLAAYVLLHSRLGLGILAVREDEEAAQATGVDALRHKLAALALSALFAGLAGATFAYYHVSYYPELAFSPHWTFDAVLITFIGGLGTLIGPIVGAVFYVLVREQLAVTLVNVHQVIFGILFIVVVLTLPGGLVDLSSRLRRKR